jgi:hypothetical protein
MHNGPRLYVANACGYLWCAGEVIVSPSWRDDIGIARSRQDIEDVLAQEPASTSHKHPSAQEML